MWHYCKVNYCWIIPVILGFFGLYWQFNNINPDTISYLDIAQKYASGYYFEAYNSYWSPLLSVLVAIFIKVGGNALIVTKILQLLLFLGSLYLLRRLVAVFTADLLWSKLVILCAGINLAYYSQAMVGPDFLGLVLFLYLLVLLFNNQNPFWIGLVILLIYFAKYYLLFVAVPSTVVYFILFRKDEIFRKLIFSSKVFLVVFTGVLCWVYLGGKKYHEYKISSAGGYNKLAAIPGGFDHVWLHVGLVPPADEHSTFFWTDVHPNYKKFENRFPRIEGKGIKIIKANIIKAIRLLIINSLPGICAVLGLFYLWYKRKSIKKEVLFLIFISMNNIAGYLLFSSEHRYFWLSFILLNLLILFIQIPKKYLATFFIFFFISTTIHSWVRIFDKRFDETQRAASQEILAVIPSGSKVVSYHTRQTWFISFYNKYKDYGGIAQENMDSVMNKLAINKIDYIIYPDSNSNQINRIKFLANMHKYKCNKYYYIPISSPPTSP